MKSKGLRQAGALFNARKFRELIRILEPQVYMHRENPRFYYMLGIACLNTGDVGGAYSYLTRSHQLDQDHLDCRAALAYTCLRRGQSDEAIRLWLNILDESPRNTYARRGLDLVRKAADHGSLDAALDSRAGRRLVPGPAARVPLVVLVGVCSIAAVVGVVYGGFVAVNRPDGDPRAGIESFKFSGPLVDPGVRTPLMLSEGEIRSTLDEIESYLQDFQDDFARREINRILLSNAQPLVKNRVRLVLPHLTTPTFADFSGTFVLAEVAANPLLYEGCHVRWTGRTANIRVGADRIDFELLVGYVGSAILEGVVPCYLEFAARIQPGAAYQVIGRVEPFNGSFRLRITSIHQVGI